MRFYGIERFREWTWFRGFMIIFYFDITYIYCILYMQLGILETVCVIVHVSIYPLRERLIKVNFWTCIWEIRTNNPRLAVKILNDTTRPIRPERERDDWEIPRVRKRERFYLILLPADIGTAVGLRKVRHIEVQGWGRWPKRVTVRTVHLQYCWFSSLPCLHSWYWKLGESYRWIYWSDMYYSIYDL